MITRLVKSLFAMTLMCMAQIQAASQAPVVTDSDLVMSCQPNSVRSNSDSKVGETKRNLSVDGNPLSIAGKKYSEGIGTHADSMIPISTIPEHNVLTGACGIDDEAQGEGSIQFQILSGSEVLWESPIMKKGMPAVSFEVALVNKEKKLYLVALKVENKRNDHGDWVDLKWQTKKLTLPPRKSQQLLRSQDFGIQANVEKDQGPAFRKLISEARWNPGCTISIPSGTYHFYPEGALKMSYHILKHDEYSFRQSHPVGLPFVDLNKVKIQADGARFVFHGLMQPILVMDSSQITMEGISIDYANPLFYEMTIKEIKKENKGAEIIGNIDQKLYPYKIDKNKLVYPLDTDSSYISPSIYIVDKGEPGRVDNLSDSKEHVTQNNDGTVNFKFEYDPTTTNGGNKIDHLNRLVAGDILSLHAGNGGLSYPALCIYRAKNTILRKVFFITTQVTDILAQRSENIAIFGGGSVHKKIKGLIHPVSNTNTDAAHFSNIKGKIHIENARYENIQGNGIYVHSTSFDIEEIISPTELRCRSLDLGCEVFLPGESIDFIAEPSLQKVKTGKVKSIRKLSSLRLIINLEEPLPAEVKKGDRVENAGSNPAAVTFKNNIVSNNQRHGAVFITPKKVIVEGNKFSNLDYGPAIQLSGSSVTGCLYEGGRCLDVQIRNNTFCNNNLITPDSSQFKQPIIFFDRDSLTYKEGQLKYYYHENISIENNTFDTLDRAILFAISTNGIKFINNKTTYNNDNKELKRKAFEFEHCKNILIKGNTSSKKEWTIEDVLLKKTDVNDVKFN